MLKDMFNIIVRIFGITYRLAKKSELKKYVDENFDVPKSIELVLVITAIHLIFLVAKDDLEFGFWGTVAYELTTALDIIFSAICITFGLFATSTISGKPPRFRENLIYSIIIVTMIWIITVGGNTFISIITDTQRQNAIDSYSFWIRSLLASVVLMFGSRNLLIERDIDWLGMIIGYGLYFGLSVLIDQWTGKSIVSWIAGKISNL
tara:strand:- start:5300 stop:5917 length:618 start_codon:yes stop_codon:yes gene_type:complete